MKIVSTIARAALLSGLIIATSASADDKAAPDLLSGISESEIQQLSPGEASDTRGERIRVRVGVRPGWCGWKPCLKSVYRTYVKKFNYKGRVIYVKH